jgi:hypothetical protein
MEHKNGGKHELGNKFRKSIVDETGKQKGPFGVLVPCSNSDKRLNWI